MEALRIANREDFEHWLAELDVFLAEFIEEFPDSAIRKFDYSPASLDLAEAWILMTFDSTDAMLLGADGRRVNCVACYVGETFRRAVKGKWTINLEDSSFAYFGLPTIVAPGKDSECPLSLVTTAADRRTGRFIRTILENY
jgi:hypothetical protein